MPRRFHLPSESTMRKRSSSTSLGLHSDGMAEDITTTAPPSTTAERGSHRSGGRGTGGGNNSKQIGNSSRDKHSLEVERKNRAVRCLRIALIATLVIAATVTASLTYVYVKRDETEDFENQYYDSVVKVAEGFQNGVNTKAWSAATFASMYTSRYGHESEHVWPNATMPDFQEQAVGQLNLANGRALSFNPIIHNDTRLLWEAHAEESAWILGANCLVDANDTKCRSVDQGIFQVREGQRIYDPGLAPGSRYNKTLVPVWQIAPIVTNEKAVMFNLHSESNRQRALDDMLFYKVPTLTAILQLVQDQIQRPSSILFYPVFGSYDEDADDKDEVVGSISIVFSWDDVLAKLLPNYIKGLVCVLETSIDQKYTYSITGDDVTFLGEGDLHDDSYDDMGRTFDANLEGTDDVLGDVDNLITYKINIYPSSELESQYVTSRPATYCTGVVLIFVCTAAVFLLYDYLVEYRQNMVTRAAERSGQIVDAMFPAAFRDRLFQNQEAVRRNSDSNANNERDGKGRRRLSGDRMSDESAGMSEAQTGAAATAGGSNKRGSVLDSIPNMKINKFIKQRVLPSKTRRPDYDVGANMGSLEAEAPIADLFPDTSIMFCDLVGFTAWSAQREPEQVFQLLEALFWEFDQLAAEFGVFKLGTIGDCYIAVTGLPDPMEDHAVVLAEFTIECAKRVEEVRERLEHSVLDTKNLKMRFGIHSGPVTAGILRGQKSRFELFGDTINTASRMESTGVPGKIQVSEETAAFLKEEGMAQFLTKRDTLVHAKGKGDLQTYWLEPHDDYASLERGKGDKVSFALSRMQNESRAARTTPPVGDAIEARGGGGVGAAALAQESYHRHYYDSFTESNPDNNDGAVRRRGSATSRGSAERRGSAASRGSVVSFCSDVAVDILIEDEEEEEEEEKTEMEPMRTYDGTALSPPIDEEAGPIHDTVVNEVTSPSIIGETTAQGTTTTLTTTNHPEQMTAQ